MDRKLDTHDLSEHSLEEDLHNDRRIREDGGDDLRLLADGHSDLVVQTRQARFDLRSRCFRVWQCLPARKDGISGSCRLENGKLGSHRPAHETTCGLLHALLRDEEVVLIDVDLNARLATIEVLQRLGAVLQRTEVRFFADRRHLDRKSVV